MGIKVEVAGKTKGTRSSCDSETSQLALDRQQKRRCVLEGYCRNEARSGWFRVRLMLVQVGNSHCYDVREFECHL